MIPSGESRYFSHSTFQSASVNGGRIPVIGFHSVILNPDSVNLVKPPMTTIPNTSAEQPNNQLGNDRGIAADVVGGAADDEADPVDASCAACLSVAASRVVVDSRRKEGEKNVFDRARGWNRCE